MLKSFYYLKTDCRLVKSRPPGENCTYLGEKKSFSGVQVDFGEPVRQELVMGGGRGDGTIVESITFFRRLLSFDTVLVTDFLRRKISHN